MNTKKLLIYGGLAFAAYYLWKQTPSGQAATLASQAALNPQNAETPAEQAASAAATLSAQLAASFPG